ncbi:hypothetical protein [Glycomyces rhizosphaerae]|uniref:Uncharacterized protein n=1 Tax=Glycomyces rhizosphaerae TaxID=2054422 RepID=A0ABV7Q029_9ACTN
MAGLYELSAKIEADRAAVEAVAGPINSSKGQAEHATVEIGGLGAEAASVRMRAVVDKIEEAESIRATLQGSLVKAHFIVLSAIHGTMGPRARASGATGGDSSGESAISPQPVTEFDFVAGLDHEPGPDQLRYIADEPAKLPEEIDPFDDSRLTSRPVRAVRVAARGVEDLQGGTKQVTTDAVNFQHFFDPPADNEYTESLPKDTGPQFTNDPPSATPLDPIQAVANFTAMGVAVAKVAVGEMRKRNR